MTLKPADPQAIVIFGASGDLTKRKLLPAFFHLYAEGLLPHGFAIAFFTPGFTIFQVLAVVRSRCASACCSLRSSVART